MFVLLSDVRLKSLQDRRRPTCVRRAPFSTCAQNLPPLTRRRTMTQSSSRHSRRPTGGARAAPPRAVRRRRVRAGGCADAPQLPQALHVARRGQARKLPLRGPRGDGAAAKQVRQSVGTERNLLNGQMISTSDMDFVINEVCAASPALPKKPKRHFAQNMVHISEVTVSRCFAGWFIRNTEHAQRVLDASRTALCPRTSIAVVGGEQVPTSAAEEGKSPGQQRPKHSV